MQLPALYQRSIAELGYQADPAQQRAVVALERVRRDLAARTTAGRLRRWLAGERHRAPVQGLYLWGGVGRGKTFVMDLFFESVPGDRKLRYHFHRLMYRVHRRLAALGERRDPLDTVARELAGQASLLCFDEFFVSDIADAMILGRLLERLFARGVTLVATSNIPPDELYRDGLQRQKFLPAIELIKRHTDVMEVDGGVDFRLRVLEKAEIYHWPLDAGAETSLARSFAAIAPDAGTEGQPIEILGRKIPTRRRADGIVWFDFDVLCGGPRSQDDYIELARAFQTVILSDVPVLDTMQDDAARRFIALVDEFYDRRVKLILSAAAPIEQLYAGRRLAPAFERTASRLYEMQSQDYLGARHVAG